MATSLKRQAADGNSKKEKTGKLFYKEALGTQLNNVQALRARRPAGIRHAPTPSATRSARMDAAQNLFQKNISLRHNRL